MIFMINHSVIFKYFTIIAQKLIFEQLYKLSMKVLPFTIFLIFFSCLTSNIQGKSSKGFIKIASWPMSKPVLQAEPISQNHIYIRTTDEIYISNISNPTVPIKIIATGDIQNI